MKQHYFVKFDPRINQITGCHRATLILSTLEYWFQKKPDGFYKFIEACSHRLYKEGDSWTEQLDCDPKSFSTSFKKIGIKYISRSAFDLAEDKFQGKMYASYYDRYTNQTFFIRNHEVADATLSTIFYRKKMNLKVEEGAIAETNSHPTTKSSVTLVNLPISIGKNSRSYRESKNTSKNLSKDKYHAEEVIKKMIEIWTAIVEEGRDQIGLTNQRIAFLKKAFVDKFDSCLEKWKQYCKDIASSHFLMGEVNDFRADLDWSLKFANIQKVMEGKYGIGKRVPKVSLTTVTDLEEAITNSAESTEIKRFRHLCLKTVGNGKYLSYFKDLKIEFSRDGGINLIAPLKFSADILEQNCYSYLRVILEQLGKDIHFLSILTTGETKGRRIEKKRGGEPNKSLVTEKEPKPPSYQFSNSQVGRHSCAENASKEGRDREICQKTQEMVVKLRQLIPPKQFPSWLDTINVEEIRSNGTLVTTFDDALTVNWCKEHFAQEILQAAKEAWQGVQYVDIRQKSIHLQHFSSRDEVGDKERSLFHQAIESLKEMALSDGEGSCAYG